MPSIFGAPKTNEGKTLASLRKRLIFELGNRTDVPTDQWNEWINDAYLDLVETLALRELKDSYQFATTATQELYTLPQGVFTIRGVTVQAGSGVNEGYGLTLIDVGQYRKEYYRTGTPTKYLRDGDVLVLYPTPDGVYEMSVDITITPQLLTVDTDSPIIEVGKHEALFYLAKQKAAEGLQDFTTAEMAGRKASSLLGRKRDPEQVEKQNLNIGLRPIRSERDFIRRSSWRDDDGVR